MCCGYEIRHSVGKAKAYSEGRMMAVTVIMLEVVDFDFAVRGLSFVDVWEFYVFDAVAFSECSHNGVVDVFDLSYFLKLGCAVLTVQCFLRALPQDFFYEVRCPFELYPFREGRLYRKAGVVDGFRDKLEVFVEGFVLGCGPLHSSLSFCSYSFASSRISRSFVLCGVHFVRLSVSRMSGP